MVLDVVLRGIDGLAVVHGGVLSVLGGRAVTADVDRLALILHKVGGNVLLARGVDEASGVSVLVDISGVTTVAGATSWAVDDSLGAETNRGVSLQASEDVETIGNGGGGALGPAWSAVLGNVLVLVPWEVGLTVHVSPVNVGGDVIGGVDFPSAGHGLDFTTSEGSRLNTAATQHFGEEGLVGGGVLSLGEGVDALVVKRIVPLSVSGLVADAISPGVLGSGPGAVRLDSNVVGATANANKSVFSVMATPRVTNSPVLLSGNLINTIADNRDVVDDVHVSSLVKVDARHVVLKGLGHGDTAGDGATRKNFLHHVFLTYDLTELIDLVHVVGVRDVASLTRGAVTADVHGGTHLAIVKALSAVDRAGLVSHFIVVHPFVGVVCLTTVATQILIFTGDDNLGRYVDVGPGSVTGNLDTVRERRGGGVGPAGTAVLGDVLVADVGKVVGAVDIVPEPLFGEISDVDERGVDDGGSLVVVVLVAGDVGVGVKALGGSDGSNEGDSEGSHI
jgi:hypothetical protein